MKREKRAKSPTPSPSSPARRKFGVSSWLLSALSLSLFALSLYARIEPAWGVVFPSPDRVQLLDVDPYYHLRHTRYAIEHFPNVQRWDVGTHFPEGERSPHAGLFHVALALVSLVVGGQNPSADLVTRVLAWSPVAFYVVSAALLVLLARRLLSWEYAALSLAIFALFPGLSFARTTLGFGDHHAAEIALILWTLWGVVASLSRHRANAESPGTLVATDSVLRSGLIRFGGWLNGARYALPLLLFQFTWSGAPLIVALIGAALGACLVLDIWRDFDCSATGKVARDFGIVLSVGMFLAHASIPDAIMIERLYRPSLLAFALLAALGAVAGSHTLVAALQRRFARIAVVAALLMIGALGVALVLWRLPAEYRQQFAAKTAAVQEQQAVSIGQFLGLQGLFGLLALSAVPLVGKAALTSRALRPHFTLSVFGALLTAAWLVAHDYSYAPPAILALSSALAIWQIASRFPSASRTRTWLPGATLALGASQIWPLGVAQNPFASEPQRLLQINPGWFEAMAWLGSSTPKPTPTVLTEVPAWQGAGYAYDHRSYGVLSAWDFGNFIAALGERVPLRSHSFSKALAEWLVSPSESISLRRLCPKCRPGQSVRYVVLSAPTLAEHFLTNVQQSSRPTSEFAGELGQVSENGQQIALRSYGEAYQGTIGFQLYVGDANGLQHHRLVFESADQTLSSYQTLLPDGSNTLFDTVTRVSNRLERGTALERAKALMADPLQPVQVEHSLLYGHVITSSVKIFQVVTGARVVGRTEPGASLTVFLGLETKPGARRFVYRQSQKAGPNGEFEIVMPYSSAGSSDAVVAYAPAQLLVETPNAGGTQVFRLSISEQAVESGALISIGDLVSAGADRAPGK